MDAFVAAVACAFRSKARGRRTIALICTVRTVRLAIAAPILSDTLSRNAAVEIISSRALCVEREQSVAVVFIRAVSAVFECVTAFQQRYAFFVTFALEFIRATAMSFGVASMILFITAIETILLAVTHKLLADATSKLTGNLIEPAFGDNGRRLFITIENAFIGKIRAVVNIVTNFG